MTPITKLIGGLMLACGLLSSCGTKSADEKSSQNDSTATTENMTDTTSLGANDVKVLVKTTEGDFTVLLYGDTPKHRDNFVKLVNEGYYDNTLFHRVINEFMVQAGDPDSKTAPKGKQLGSGGPEYTIPAEINFPTHYHKRGALAAARTGDNVNPMKESSGSQFYIVTGKKITKAEVANIEKYMEQGAQQAYFNKLAAAHKAEIDGFIKANNQQALNELQQKLIAETEQYFAANPFKLPKNVIEDYVSIGGTPHLDNNYTVFGEVLSGMETIDKIEKAKTDAYDRPDQDIRILSMEIVK